MSVLLAICTSIHFAVFEQAVFRWPLRWSDHQQWNVAQFRSLSTRPSPVSTAVGPYYDAIGLINKVFPSKTHAGQSASIEYDLSCDVYSSSIY
mmetsp:Transcript_8989/g.12477  ORF Transcript_8989/g.12477 Transcript_8989/m.12477 type:complete len:93 (+) Transcript_8989:810-1088(+)